MGSRDSKSLSVTISCNGGDAVERLVAGTRDFCQSCAIETGRAARLVIMIEELATNLVEHGGIGEDGAIELILTHGEGVVAIMLSDSGASFDPRAARSPADIPERGGGAGIDLVRAWADIVDYRSQGGRNRLSLKMWL